MSCDKPNGDCTNVSPCGSCGGCGCGGSTTPTPILPKCQDVSLIPGTYTNATIIINSTGCLSSVTNGAAPLYTPDDCCGGSGGGTGGEAGARGPKGDPGQAATVTVDPVIAVGSDSLWHVVNTGTVNAAVFKFTSPMASSSGGTTTSGVTGNICGLNVQAGLVKALPTGLVTGVTATAKGTYASYIILNATAATPSAPCDVDIQINLDAFYSKIVGTVSTDYTNLAARVTALETRTATLVGVNGSLAWNGTGSAQSFVVKNASNITQATLAASADSYVGLPDTFGEVFKVYIGTVLVGVYKT